MALRKGSTRASRPPKLGVGVDEGPEVGEVARALKVSMGRPLVMRISGTPRAYLGDELGVAGGVVLVGVILG